MAMARGLPDGPVPPNKCKNHIIKQILKSYSRSIIIIIICLLRVWLSTSSVARSTPSMARSAA
eukprot:5923093-Heterocapsa_arctica.AAC.1